MVQPVPAITFRVNLSLKLTEQVGPDIGHTDPAASTVNGDTFPSNPTLAATLNANRPNNISTWLPGLNGAGGREVKHGATFTAYGEEAVYLKSTYGIGVAGVAADRQWLDIVTEV